MATFPVKLKKNNYLFESRLAEYFCGRLFFIPGSPGTYSLYFYTSGAYSFLLSFIYIKHSVPTTSNWSYIQFQRYKIRVNTGSDDDQDLGYF